MLICSLACLFLLGASDVSAQFLPVDQAVLKVKHELSTLQQITPVSNGTLGSQPQISMDVKLKTVFLERVLEKLNETSTTEVQGAIEAVYNTAITSANPARHAKINEVKQFTEDLLAD